MPITIEIERIQLGPFHSVNELFDEEKLAQCHPEVALQQEQGLLHRGIPWSDYDSSNITWDAEVIYLLLTDAELTQAKGADYQFLLNFWPELEKKRNVYLFPYGRSAMQLALRQASKQFSQGVGSLQILAFHADPRIRDTTLLGTTHIANECLIVARITPESQGVRMAWSSYEVQTKDKPVNVPIAALFSRYRSQYGVPRNQGYFPSAIGSELREAWTNSVAPLGDCITSDTQFVLADAYTGDIGACSGLYSLYHLYERYQQKHYQGVTLQLDVSNEKYRSLMAYEWHEG